MIFTLVPLIVFRLGQSPLKYKLCSCAHTYTCTFTVCVYTSPCTCTFTCARARAPAEHEHTIEICVGAVCAHVHAPPPPPPPAGRPRIKWRRFMCAVMNFTIYRRDMQLEKNDRLMSVHTSSYSGDAQCFQLNFCVNRTESE